MSGLFGANAECGPSNNPIASLNKLFNQDTNSLNKQDYAGPTGSTSNGGFRQHQSRSSNNIEANQFYQPQPQHAQRSFDLTPLQRALTPQPVIPAWAQAFNQSNAVSPLVNQQRQSPAPEWANDFTRFDTTHQTGAVDHQQRSGGVNSRSSTQNNAWFAQQRNNPNMISQSRLFNATGINGGSFANDIMNRGQDLSLRQNQLQSGRQDVVQSAQDWETAFLSQEAAKSVVDPLAAYTQAHVPVEARPRSPVLSDSMARDILAQTAGHLLSAVQTNESSREMENLMDNSSTDKFANSTFLNLMRKLRDGEVVVEGDKMVEQIGPAIFSNDGAKGKEREYMSAGREEEGRSNAGVPSFNVNKDNVLRNNINNGHSVTANGEGIGYSQEGYNDMEDIWESEDLHRLQREQAKLERHQERAERVQFQGDGGGGEAAFERDEMMTHLRADTRVLGATENWEEDFGGAEMIAGGHALQPSRSQQQQQRNRPPTAQQLEWDALQNDWDTFEATATGVSATSLATENLASASTSNSLFGYSFAQNNPYIITSRSQSPVTQTHSHHAPQTTYESLLGLEAAVLSNPTDSSAWLALGIKQQENEREEMAILALTRALELDPDMTDAYLALAVSYTNENERGKAYESIDKWINCLGVGERNYAREIDNYRDLFGKLPGASNGNSSMVGASGAGGRGGSMERHDYLAGLLIRLAQSRAEKDGGDVDANVQIGLGVLFNTSEEYEKAGDCFESALSVRPDDPLLFNRLGATLANSGKAQEAIRYYLEAIAIQPSYVRARFNLAVANMNLNNHHIASNHLLTALTIQESDSALRNGGDNGLTSGVTSQALWDSLNIALLMMHENDIAAYCATRDISRIRDLLGRIPIVDREGGGGEYSQAAPPSVMEV